MPRIYAVSCKKSTKWLRTDDPEILQLKNGILTTTIRDLMKKNVLDPSYRIHHKVFNFPNEDDEEEDASAGEIHVLVQLPSTRGDGNTVAPEVQLRMCKSVVRISSKATCVGTAVVADRTATHLYLLTNLHWWIDEAFIDDLSTEFKNEIKPYFKLHPRKKPCGKSGEDSSALQNATSVKPPVVIEQNFPDSNMLENILTFRLDRDVCWI